jgi:hypothetical protein
MTIFEPRARGVSRKRREFSQRGLVLPLALFCVILAFYAVTTAAILTTEGLALFALVPLTGFLVVMLFVIGHDACHQSFTSSRPLNELIGRIAFLPSSAFGNASTIGAIIDSTTSRAWTMRGFHGARRSLRRRALSNG